MKRETQEEKRTQPDVDSEAMLRQFYFRYRDEFLRAFSKYELDEAARLDVYQDAMIVLVEAMRKGKVTLQNNAKSYLFGIGRNLFVDRIKSELKKRELQADLKNQADISENVTLDHIELSHRQQTLQQAIRQLGKKCQEILTLFYYRKYAIEAIQKAMNYNSENVVKAHKSRCLKQLREIMKA
ncbi:MAG: sigma-70 family RNA polymerase sigma factor [Bacteroidota bacterium]